jgi:hypothetical protein
MGQNLNPFGESRKPSEFSRARPTPMNGCSAQYKSPAWGGAFANASQMGCYLAGAVDESVVDFLLFDDLLCFL